MSEFRKTSATVTTLRTTLQDLHETASTLPPLPPPSQPIPPAPSVALSRQLNEVSESAGALSDKMDTYRSRLTAVDPVTGQARYGDKMKKSVFALLEDYAGQKSARGRCVMEINLVHGPSFRSRNVVPLTPRSFHSLLALLVAALTAELEVRSG